MALTPTQVKEKFKNDGITFSSWARANGYRPQEVIRVRIDGLSHIKVAQNEWAKCVGFRLTIGERTNG